MTSITITFENVNPIPVGSYIEIIYDDIWIYVNDREKVACSSNLV